MFLEWERILRAAGLDLDDEDLLDALWLSRRLPHGVGTPLARRVAEVPAADAVPKTAPAPSAGPHRSAADAVPGSPGVPAVSSPPPEPRAADPDHRAAVIGAPSPTTDSRTGGLRLPGAKVLGSELSLGRALRPLKRRVPSAFHTELDEQATAASQADTRIPNVVLRALPERWLRLALVIDSEVSMVLWERHCRELQAALEHSGAFRQIEVHQLSYGAAVRASSSRQRGVFLVRPWSGSRTTTLPTTALNDASGRTLVLVITDGAAPAWQDGRMRVQLEQWAKSGPTAVVHVLPRHLWAGTGVTADTWHVTAPRPGSPNTAWRVRDPLLPPDVSSFAGVPVPVVELTPSGLHAWATAITTVGRPAPLRLWEPRTAAETRSAGAVPRPGARAFVRTASPSAVRLAAHLAAVAPVTVPVMHLVQACLPGAAGTSALAEIFLGGLLRPVAREGQARPDGPMKHRLFDFTEETKDLLLDTVPLRDLIACSHRVGEHIEQLVGRSPDFPAWLVSSGRSDRPGGESHPFARIGTSLLSLLGYDDTEDLSEDDDAVVDAEPVTGDRASSAQACSALVLTSLPVEYAAVRSRLMERRELVHPNGTRVEKGRLAGTPWFVAIAELGESSQTTAALTAHITSWLRPEAVLFVGVSGSLKGDIAMGDVVVGTKVYEFQGGKQTPEGFLVRPTSWPASHALVQAARSAVRDLPDVRTHFKPVAAGDVVLADARSQIVRNIGEHYSDAAAMDMASAGAAQAALVSGQVDFLTVRGIGDRLHATKHAAAPPGSLERAATGAATVAAAVLRRYLARRDPVEEQQESTRQGSRGSIRAGDHLDFSDGPAIVRTSYQYSPSPSPTALNSLPAASHGFTGRGGELARLLDALAPRVPDDSSGVSTAVISGLGGIGKTALAVQAAHRACESGWFPGGVLFTDLHGYDDTPVTADQALESLLRALGIDPEYVPRTTDERIALYRAILAERARQHGPMLIMADNASSPEQVRPLLPGDSTHRFLVTSRHRMTQLDAGHILLGQLSPEESLDLLHRALTIADASDNRILVDVAGAGRLAKLCGHLPLALQIAAALLAEAPGRPVADLVDQLAASHDRLDHLDDGYRSVRAAFNLSYRSLPPEQARLLGLLALAPGPEASDEVVAALVGSAHPPTRSLSSLARAHLVERGGGAWRVHDLVREFGAGVIAADAQLREEGAAARERVLTHYRRWTGAADARLRWLPGTPEPDRFATRAQALAWLDSERAGLVAAVHWATEERYARTAVDLAGCLAHYLSWRRYFADWITVNTVALDATRLIGDPVAEAIAYRNLGRALQETGRGEEAVLTLSRARDLYQQVGNRHGEAKVWSDLGNALRLVGRVEEAVDALSRARDLHQAVGDRVGEGMAWNNLGLALHAAGRMDEAMQSLTRARHLYNAAGDRHSEGITWHNLGLTLHGAERATEAVEAYDRAVDILQEFEDWYGMGRALDSRADVHMDSGERVQARDSLLAAAEAYTRADAHTEAARSRARAQDLM